MAFVSRYGNKISEDGWRMVDQAECEWISPAPGVTIQVRKGIPATILGAFAARFHKIVEPLRDNDTACWTPTNTVATSNHMAGTAMDLNWGSHPFHVRGTFGDRLPALRQLLDDFEGCVWWGGDWQSPIDEMHFQLNYREGYLDDNGNFVLDVDDRLTSLANRLQGEAPPPPPEDNRTRYARAIIAEGQRRGVTPRGIQIALATALVESNLTMYANSSVPQSLNMPYEAVGHDHDSVGLFQQRCPMWGPVEVLMDPAKSAGLFYDHLVKLDYNGPNSPGSYAQAVQRSAYPGRYDERYDDAVALYNRYVTAQPMEDDDFMSALTADEQRQIYNEICGPRTSRSPLRHVGEGVIGNIETLEQNMDGSIHVLVMWVLAAYLKSPDHLALLQEVAGNTEPDRQWDAKLAQAMLNKINQMSDTGCPVSSTSTGAHAAAPERVAAPVYPASDPAPIPTTPLVGVTNGMVSSLSDLQNVIKQFTDVLNTFLK